MTINDSCIIMKQYLNEIRNLLKIIDEDTNAYKKLSQEYDALYTLISHYDKSIKGQKKKISKCHYHHLLEKYLNTEVTLEFKNGYITKGLLKHDIYLPYAIGTRKFFKKEIKSINGEELL